MPQNAELKKILSEYTRGVTKLKKSIHRLKKAVLQFRPFKEAWTIHEHVIHLVDMEINAYIRWRLIAAESGKLVTLVDENLWTKNIHYHQQSLDDYLSLFSLIRKVTFHYLSNHLDSEAIWNNFIVHPERGKITLKDWIRLYSGHVHTHLKYIERNKNIWMNKNPDKVPTIS